MGRSSLLSPQPYQSVAPLRQCDELSVFLSDDFQGSSYFGPCRLAGRHDDAAVWTFLLRAQGLRRGQSGYARAQGRNQGWLQSAQQGRAAGDLGDVAAYAVSQPDFLRPI